MIFVENRTLTIFIHIENDEMQKSDANDETVMQQPKTSIENRILCSSIIL